MSETAQAVNPARDGWATRLGVILAVTGSAVGLGNFLRFPGLAAEYGGGVFMVPYLISFLLLGLPIAWAEWSLGRAGGSKGYNSAPGVLRGVWGGSAGGYLGFLGPLIPMGVYMYYVLIEAWCLCYAIMYATGGLWKEGDESNGAFFERFTGIAGDGTIGLFLIGSLVVCFVLNFFLIYRGLSKGIELFCRIAMPALIVIALVILVRVLTLGGGSGAEGDNKYDLLDGLGAMWNPTPSVENLAAVADDGSFADPGLEALRAVNRGLPSDVTSSGPMEPLLDIDIRDGYVMSIPSPRRGTEQDEVLEVPARLLEQAGWKAEGVVFTHSESRLTLTYDGDRLIPTAPGFLASLANPELWLAAAGQIFFSLSIGFGIILVYASYMKPDDDVALSSLTAAGGNGFCEVALGGLITIPAAFMFLGPAFVANPPGTFGMGFASLPDVFATMPGGAVWGFLFFFLLFLAAVTSSLSMIQPAVAFVEEGLGWGRLPSVGAVLAITAVGATFVAYFSGGAAAIDAIDFWVGSVLIFVFATIIVLIFGWKLGRERGWAELTRGADIKLPRVVMFVIRYVAPVYLLTIFAFWVWQNLIPRIETLIEDGFRTADGGWQVQPLALVLIAVVAALVLATLIVANARWSRRGPGHAFPVEPRPYKDQD